MNKIFFLFLSKDSFDDDWLFAGRLRLKIKEIFAPAFDYNNLTALSLRICILEGADNEVSHPLPLTPSDSLVL
jgi:hypothetical protein